MKSLSLTSHQRLTTKQIEIWHEYAVDLPVIHHNFLYISWTRRFSDTVRAERRMWNI